jgi:PAS domain S-box-containing protein/putative nucleotidyltransferase with HDIG domain
MKILIVEDDIDSRILLERALPRQGYSIESAANGVQALQKAVLSPPDLIISDIMMPEMDGFELCRRIKADERLRTIPFVFYTSTYIDQKDERLAMALGASRFLIKPMKMEEFFDIISEVIEKNRAEHLPVLDQLPTEMTALDRMQVEVYARKLQEKVRELEKEHETLEGNKLLLSQTQQIAKVGGWEYDVEKGRIVWTDEVYRIYGLSPDEYDPNDTAQDIAFYEDRAVIENAFRRVVEFAEPYDFELKFRNAHGESLWVKTTGRAEVKNGKVVRVSGTIMDITDRKSAEEELARLYQQVKEEAEISGALVKIVNALNSSLSETELVRNVVTLAPSYLRFDRLVIFLYDESLKGFTLAGGYGLSHVDEGMLVSRIFRERDFPAMSSFLKGETVLIEKALGSDLLTKELVDTFEIGSILLAPIMIRGKVIGGIVGDCKSSEAIKNRDVSLMKGLADGMAIALHNSRLYVESLERLMELSGKIETIKTMAMLDREILSTIDRVTILKAAVAMVSRIIPCERAAILFREGENYRVISEWGVGRFLDNVYSGKKSHFDALGMTSTSLFIPDVASDGTDCLYHREQNAIGIKSSLMVPLVTKGETIGLLDIGSTFHGRLAPEHLSAAVNIASQITVALENAMLYEDLQQLLVGTITSLAAAIDAKSPWTNGHSERVTQYAVEIGKELGLKDHDLEMLRLSALLHDVGKIGTYDIVLDKPGKLTEEEFALVKKHPKKGAEILAPIKQLIDVIPGVLHHHERYDGKGYPDGLKEEDIPLQARILCVADSFDAMTADRPYRTASGKDYAISEIKRWSGTQFDPKVVAVFLGVLDRLSI